MFTSLKIYTSLAILLSIYFFATYPPADSFVIIHHCLFGFECNDMHFLFRCFLKWPVALNHSSFETLMWIPNMISWMVLIIILSFKTSPTCRTEKKNSALLILPRWRLNLAVLVIFFSEFLQVIYPLVYFICSQELFYHEFKNQLLKMFVKQYLFSFFVSKENDGL